MEAPRPQVFTQKDTQRGIKLQMTPRDGAEHGGVEADAQGKGGEEHDATTRYRQGTGPLVEAGRGGDRACGWWRQAKIVRDPCTGEPWGKQVPDCAG